MRATSCEGEVRVAPHLQRRALLAQPLALRIELDASALRELRALQQRRVLLALAHLHAWATQGHGGAAAAQGTPMRTSISLSVSSTPLRSE